MPQMSPPEENPSDNWRIHRGALNPYSTVDDRFTFPPVPGYTGYVPQNREHFGQSYARTTKSALKSFEEICASNTDVPIKVNAVVQCCGGTGNCATVAIPGTTTKVKVRIESDPHLRNIPTGHRSVEFKKKVRAAELRVQCAQDHIYLPGYTGFIPRERHRFGQQYQKIATAAMSEFKSTSKLYNSRVADLEHVAQQGGVLASGGPQSGLDTGRQAPRAVKALHPLIHAGNTPQIPKKDLLKMLPIPGYQGFLPLYQMAGQHSFGRTSKDCIETFRKMNATNLSH